MKEHRVCLLLGSNIQPEENLPRAIRLLQKEVKILQISSVWETPSEGWPGPNFLNLAMLIATPLNENELKDQIIRPVETQLGRVRSENKNAPRPIDLDIILFDGQQVDKNLWKYAHRAVPVAEIFPDYRSVKGNILNEVAFSLAQKTPIHLKEGVLVESLLNARYYSGQDYT